MFLLKDWFIIVKLLYTQGFINTDLIQACSVVFQLEVLPVSLFTAGRVLAVLRGCNKEAIIRISVPEAAVTGIMEIYDGQYRVR